MLQCNILGNLSVMDDATAKHKNAFKIQNGGFDQATEKERGNRDDYDFGDACLQRRLRAIDVSEGRIVSGHLVWICEGTFPPRVKERSLHFMDDNQQTREEAHVGPVERIVLVKGHDAWALHLTEQLHGVAKHPSCSFKF